MPRPLTDKPSMYWITRLDAYWRVWVTSGMIDSGQVYFKDSEHGSKAKALHAAQAFRDGFVAEHNIRRRAYKGDGFYVRHKKSVSGLVAVRLIVDDQEMPTRVNWRVKTMVGGKIRGKSFSVRKFGYKAAWLKAAKLRCAHTGDSVPAQPPAPPAWLLEWAEERELVALAKELKNIF